MYNYETLIVQLKSYNYVHVFEFKILCFLDTLIISNTICKYTFVES